MKTLNLGIKITGKTAHALRVIARTTERPIAEVALSILDGVADHLDNPHELRALCQGIADHHERG